MYLGIDVGTQSVKALLYDAQERRVVAVQSSPLELISDSGGTREQLAHWWLDAMGLCIRSFSTAQRSAVRAIGVSGQQHGFVPLSANGEVLAPVKLWCDTATVSECEQIMADFGGRERCVAELGNPILPGYTAPKIRWLKNHVPQAYEKLATILLPHDYINFYLTGERAMECGDASGTGLLDVRQRCWHPGMIAALDPERDLSGALPALIPHDAPVGALHGTAAETLGLPLGIPVACGGGDNMMAAIGTGNVTNGHMTISLGTSGTLFASTDTPVLDAGESLAAFCSSTGGWLPLLCTMNCTVSTELTRNLLGMNLQELEAAVARAQPGSAGVMTLPFFNGERSPNLPQGKGCIFGLDESNYTQDNVLRSAMESAVYGLRAGLDAFERQGCAIDTLRLTGGGASSASWRQMVADIFNLPVSVQTMDEGAALGAALQAAWLDAKQQGPAATLQSLLNDHLLLDETRSCQPHAATVAAYSEHYKHYQRHVTAISPLYG
jgi:xylulokinase